MKSDLLISVPVARSLNLGLTDCLDLTVDGIYGKYRLHRIIEEFRAPRSMIFYEFEKVPNDPS